jgi:hypothetical protein
MDQGKLGFLGSMQLAKSQPANGKARGKKMQRD